MSGFLICVDTRFRYSWSSVQILGRRLGRSASWLLYSPINTLSILASSISCPFRGLSRCPNNERTPRFDDAQQTLWKHAQQIATTYPVFSRNRYQLAAETLRMPYWDWSINATMPTILNEPRVRINAPSGFRSIRNPLYTYRFHPQPSNSDFPPR